MSGVGNHVPSPVAWITQACNRHEAQPAHTVWKMCLIPQETQDQHKTAKGCKHGGHLLDHEDASGTLPSTRSLVQGRNPMRRGSHLGTRDPNKLGMQ